MPVLDFPSFLLIDDALWNLPAVAFALLQGENDSDRLSAIANDDLAHRDFLYTIATMCSPENPTAAISLNNALVAGELYRAARLIEDLGLDSSMNTATGLAIADRQCPTVLIHELLRNCLAQIACGYILRRVISLHENPATKDSASLAEAAATVEAWYQDHRVVGGKRQNVIRNMWPKYRSVSHLWAAYDLMATSERKLTMPEYMTVFLGTAQWLLEQGLAITPKGRRPGDSFLSIDEMWTIPSCSVSRSEAGVIRYRVWNANPDAHDMRNLGGLPSRP